MESRNLAAAELERFDAPAFDGAGEKPKALDLLPPLIPLFERGELARRLAAAVRTKENAPSPSESDAELRARFQAASENAKEWPGLRSEYNKENGANEMLGASIKMQCEEEKTPAARGEKRTVANPVRVYATQFWLHRDDMGHGAMLPEHEAKFGKAPILAETSVGRLHLLDGHHRIFYHLREGGESLSAFVFEVATPDSQNGKKYWRAKRDFTKFDPNQPRDEQGRWSDSGGDGSGVAEAKPATAPAPADACGETTEKATVGGRTYPVRDNRDHKIDTTRMSGAAVVNDDGTVSTWHVTDTPDRAVQGLESAGPNLTHYGNVGDDLGAGFYASVAPQIWMSRSAGKWSFLSEVNTEQKASYVDHLRQEIDKQRSIGYITKNEHERALRDLNYFAEGKSDYITWAAEQPYNIASWKPEVLGKLGITPGTQPAVVELKLRGKFVDLTNGGFSQNDLIELQKRGYDGAYVSGSMAFVPQLVLWKHAAIQSVTKGQHAR